MSKTPSQSDKTMSRVLAAALSNPSKQKVQLFPITTINLLQTSSIFYKHLVASCVSPSSLPVRSMSAESTSVSDNQSNVSCSSSCSLASYFKRRRLEMTRKRGNTFEGMQENLEFENFEKIFNGLHGKLDAQALVIKGIADKNFEPKLYEKDFFE